MWRLALERGLGLVTLSRAAGLARNTASNVALGRYRGTAATREALWRALRAAGADVTIEEMMAPLPDRDVAWCRRAAARMMSVRANRRAAGLVRIAASELWNLEERTMIGERVLAHFGLAADPFREPENRSDCYVGPQQKHLEALVLEVARRREIAAVSGPVGSGKTVAVRRAVEQLEASDSFAVCHVQAVAVERVNARTIEEALLLTLAGERTSIPASHERLSRRVIEAVRHSLDSGVSPVLVIEEAHALPARALSPIKRLWERTGRGFRMGCGVVLVGQSPELPQLLALPSVRELRERTLMVEFLPLNAVDADGRPLTDETAGYLAWCFGGRSRGAARKLLDDRALAALDQHFRGRLTPLKLRLVLTSAMMLAFQRGQRTIGPEIMHEVLRTIAEPDLGGEDGGR